MTARPALLERPADSERILLAAADAMEATIIEARFHAFSPHGVSGVVVIAESHLTIHTWPEHGYAAVDIFSCGNLRLEDGINLLVREFQSERVARQTIPRGTLSPTAAGRPGPPPGSETEN